MCTEGDDAECDLDHTARGDASVGFVRALTTALQKKMISSSCLLSLLHYVVKIVLHSSSICLFF